MATLLSTLTPLIAALKADGYTVIGPVQRDGAIVLTELNSAEDLPRGWGVTLEAGTYRLRQRDDTLAFGHSAGPQSWKTYLHPPKVPLWMVRRDDFAVTEPRPTTPATPSSGSAPAICAPSPSRTACWADPDRTTPTGAPPASLSRSTAPNPARPAFVSPPGAGRPAGPAPT